VCDQLLLAARQFCATLSYCDMVSAQYMQLPKPSTMLLLLLLLLLLLQAQ
jgi:hypothetical protein